MPKPPGGGGTTPNSGTAVGAYSWTGAASGTAPVGGSAATMFTLTASATGEAPAVAPATLTVGFVHDNPTPSAGDNTIVGWLQARGDTVTLIDETSVPPTSGFDVILVSESGSASKAAAYDTNPLPVVSLEVNWSSFRLTTANAASSTASADLDLTGSHPVNTGFTDPLTVYSYALAQYTVPTTSVTPGATVTAFTGGDPTRAACVVAEAGATLTSGTAPNRRAVIGYIDPNVSNVTTAGRDYLLALVDWAAGVSGSPSPASGTAAGAYSWTGAAAGSRASTGDTLGTYSWTGAASGSRPSSGSGVGAYAYTGTASGTAPTISVNSGSASGAYAYMGTARGTAPAVGTKAGTAAGVYGWAASATGTRTSAGTTSGGYTYQSTATGTTPTLTIPGGTTVGAYTYTGAGVGTSVIQPARDITIAASPITTGWATMPTAPNPTTTGTVTCCDITGSPIETGWTANPIYLEEP